MKKPQESRWIALATDGRHVTLGRASDPSEAEIAATEASLIAQGIRGFLVVMRGAYYARHGLELLLVRPLAGATSDNWEQAKAAFLSRRTAALSA